MSEIAKTVGQRIRNNRTSLKLSQEALAELSGFHYSYIGQLERGEKNATIETIEKIAKALDIPLSKLFENLGGNKKEKDIALDCYELISAKSKEDQKRIYRILLEMNNL